MPKICKSFFHITLYPCLQCCYHALERLQPAAVGKLLHNAKTVSFHPNETRDGTFTRRIHA